MKTLKGFTLIETVIYLGLFAIIMGGILVAAYNLIEAGQHTQSVIGIQEEGIFLNRKLSWAVQSATAASTIGATLQLTRPDLPGTESPLTLSLSGTELMLQRGTNTALPLNSEGFDIIDLTFVVTHTTGKPTAVSVSFKISGQQFQFDTYLRK